MMPFDNTIPREDSPLLKLLKAGKKRVSQGWLQFDAIHNVYNADHVVVGFRYCMVGAVNYDDDGQPIHTALTNKAVDRLVEASSMLSSDHRVKGAAYNDHPGRTKADVVEVYDVAIELQEQAELKEAFNAVR